MYVNSISVLMDAEVRNVNFDAEKSELALLLKYQQEVSERHDRMHAAWRIVTGKDIDDEGTYDDFAKHAEHYLATHKSYNEAQMIRNNCQKRLEKFRKAFSN